MADSPIHQSAPMADDPQWQQYEAWARRNLLGNRDQMHDAGMRAGLALGYEMGRRHGAQPAPAEDDPADAAAEDDEQVQQIVDSLDAWPTGRYVDPHPGASNAPDGIESGRVASLTVRFDRAGFQMSVATADGETTDLSRLADLAEAAIHIEES